MDSDSSFFRIETPKNKWSKGYFDELQGEFRNIKPPNVNGECGEATKTCLLDIKIYFQIWNVGCPYSSWVEKPYYGGKVSKTPKILRRKRCPRSSSSNYSNNNT